MAIVEAENVVKEYRVRPGPRMLFRKGGVRSWLGRRPVRVHRALDDITFRLEAGRSLGIIGANGSGKSTLLKLLAGVTVPTSGHIRVEGRVASLLELGAGFHPLLTGRENVYLNAGLLGMRRAQVDAAFDSIIEFAGIGEFIDQPVGAYSSGMYVRLGFSVAMHTDPEIFLVDEVLAVGDEEFQRRCRTRINEMREQGKTIVFVSHDLSIVNTLCDDVILLTKGRMIRRNTPKETLDFYLRQVGRERGVHAMAAGDSEVIFSHGRVSIFHRQRELTAPAGAQTHVMSMRQVHPSDAADWEVVERGPARCVALGRMPRLPLTHIWELNLDEDKLAWKIGVICERPCDAETFEANFFLPLRYGRWVYAERSGDFPALLPGDTGWSVIAPPEPGCRNVALLAADGALSPLCLSAELAQPYYRLQLVNADYVAGARVLQVGGVVPERERPWAPGRHPIMTLTVDLAATPESIEQDARVREELRTARAGELAGRFERGQLRILYRDQTLSGVAHFYTSMLIGGLWNDSPSLQWGAACRDGARIRATGESRRFPLRQRWEVWAENEESLGVRIVLEALENLRIQEYHASLTLRPEYTAWETEHESGDFPDFHPGDEEWRHANRNYALSRRASASGPGIPAITLEASPDAPPVRMTAINTGYSLHSRVLQALHTPDAGVMAMGQGEERLYFEGRIRVRPRGDRV